MHFHNKTIDTDSDYFNQLFYLSHEFPVHL